MVCPKQLTGLFRRQGGAISGTRKPSLTLRVASGLRQLQKDGLCAVSFASVKVDLFEFTVERQDKMLLVMQPSVIFLIALNCVVLANRRV